MSGMQLFPEWRRAQLRAMNQANIGAASGIGLDIVIIRVGSADLAAQPVRVVTSQESEGRDSGTAQGQTADVLVVGDTDLDIQQGDEFYDPEGNLYRIKFVRPIRTVNTVAEAEVR